MKVAAHPDLIDVQSLRVGMFVHLDVGWMSHPFSTSSFKISSAAQIATIRSLGLQRVYWSPQQSDDPTPPALPSRVSEAAPGDSVASSSRADAVDADVGSTLAPLAASAPGPTAGAAAAGSATARAPTASSDGAMDPASPAVTALALEAAALERRRRQLVLQRTAQKECQRHYADATQAFKQAAALVLTRPADARLHTEALAQTLIDKMVGDGELTVRLLTESAGDKASAHAVNVSVVSMLMGRCFGFDDADLLDLGVGAVLHDIGKLRLPSRLHHFEESMLQSEVRAYQDHVAQGMLLATVMGLSRTATAIIEQHHEYADGSGFPDRLNSDRMTTGARIVSLVNRYDNLCNPYATARALTPHEALSTMFANSRSRFDATILNRFIKMMGVYPPGSTVQLTDDRYAMVVSVNSTRPLKPNVLLYEPSVPRDEAIHFDLETAAGIGIRRSIKPMQLPRPALDYLAPAQRVAYFFEPAGTRSEPV